MPTLTNGAYLNSEMRSVRSMSEINSTCCIVQERHIWSPDVVRNRPRLGASATNRRQQALRLITGPLGPCQHVSTSSANTARVWAIRYVIIRAGPSADDMRAGCGPTDPCAILFPRFQDHAMRMRHTPMQFHDQVATLTGDTQRIERSKVCQIVIQTSKIHLFYATAIHFHVHVHEICPLVQDEGSELRTSFTIPLTKSSSTPFFCKCSISARLVCRYR